MAARQAGRAALLVCAAALQGAAGLGCDPREGGAARLGWSAEAAATPPVGAAPLPAQPSAVAALGRLQPKDGVRRIAGPAQAVAVVDRLLVDKGDRVRKGQVIALLDEAELLEAAVARARAELANADAELRRHLELHAGAIVSDSVRDARQLKLDVARADLRVAEAELERNKVRSPIDGQVIEVHARDGERVGADGIVELGRTQHMYAVAEVYETDVARVKLGQAATVRSASLPRPLRGEVDRIGLKIGKLDALGTDPAARTDARVVEVEIRLAPDDVPLAAPYTHLQVEIAFDP